MSPFVMNNGNSRDENEHQHIKIHDKYTNKSWEYYVFRGALDFPSNKSLSLPCMLLAGTLTSYDSSPPIQRNCATILHFYYLMVGNSQKHCSVLNVSIVLHCKAVCIVRYNRGNTWQSCYLFVAPLDPKPLLSSLFIKSHLFILMCLRDRLIHDQGCAVSRPVRFSNVPCSIEPRLAFY